MRCRLKTMKVEDGGWTTVSSCLLFEKQQKIRWQWQMIAGDNRQLPGTRYASHDDRNVFGDVADDDTFCCCCCFCLVAAVAAAIEGQSKAVGTSRCFMPANEKATTGVTTTQWKLTAAAAKTAAAVTATTKRVSDWDFFYWFSQPIPSELTLPKKYYSVSQLQLTPLQTRCTQIYCHFFLRCTAHSLFPFLCISPMQAHQSRRVRGARQTYYYWTARAADFYFDRIVLSFFFVCSLLYKLCLVCTRQCKVCFWIRGANYAFFH